MLLCAGNHTTLCRRVGRVSLSCRVLERCRSEYRRRTMPARNISPTTTARYWSGLYIRSTPSSSSARPFCSRLLRPTLLYGIQAATLLDVAPMCRNHRVRNPQKMFATDSGDLEAVEILAAHSRQYPHQCCVKAGLRHGSEEPRLQFASHKKEIPARGMDLAVQVEATERLNYAPVASVGSTVDVEGPCHQRPILNENGADMNCWCHRLRLKPDRARRAARQEQTERQPRLQPLI